MFFYRENNFLGQNIALELLKSIFYTFGTIFAKDGIDGQHKAPSAPKKIYKIVSVIFNLVDRTCDHVKKCS